MKTWESGIFHLFLTLTLDGDEWSDSRLGCFTSTSTEGASGTRWIGCWVGPRVGLDAVEKSKVSWSCWELDPGHSAYSPTLHRLSCKPWGSETLRYIFYFPLLFTEHSERKRDYYPSLFFLLSYLIPFHWNYNVFACVCVCVCICVCFCILVPHFLSSSFHRAMMPF
jgi:hypothetical protein